MATVWVQYGKYMAKTTECGAAAMHRRAAALRQPYNATPHAPISYEIPPRNFNNSKINCKIKTQNCLVNNEMRNFKKTLDKRRFLVYFCRQETRYFGDINY